MAAAKRCRGCCRALTLFVLPHNQRACWRAHHPPVKDGLTEAQRDRVQRMLA